MKKTISEIKTNMVRGLISRGLSSKEANIVVEPLLEAELRGKKTHGIGKLFMLEEAILDRQHKPQVIKDKSNYALIDAGRELGYICANFATDILIKKAKKYGNAIVAMKNSYYYAMAGPYARKVAREGFVCIILNNGGPSAVAPSGGTQPILGTNPIAIAIPTSEEPLVLDMATSEKTWGEINLAKVEGRQLKRDTFFDKDGNFTTDPDKAEAIIPFGGTKGFGLNLFFEILTGALVGAKMGLKTKNSYDLGFLFIAISPDMFSSLNEFKIQVEELKQEIKQSTRQNGVSEIFLPGEQSGRNLEIALKKDFLEIDDSVWNKLEEFAKGQNIKSKIKLRE